jgi:hypothetical protein
MARFSEVKAFALVLTLFSGCSVWADPLYRWVDETGQVNFSDQAPGNEPGGVERSSVPSYVAPGVSPDLDPYSIINQARRLESQRKALARERREQRERDREYELRRQELAARREQQAAADMAASAPTYVVPRPIVRPRTRYPHYPPHVRRGLWAPDHPAYRPHPRSWNRPRPTPSSKIVVDREK